MSNDFSLEDAIKIAVQSTITSVYSALGSVLVVDGQGTIRVYEDANLRNLVSQATIDDLNSKLESIAKCYKIVNLTKSIEVQLSSHEDIEIVPEWYDWQEWANDSCLSSSDT